MSDIREKVRGFVVENFLFGQAGDLQDTTSFLDNGIMDSTGVLELVTHLESTYGIKVRDDELTPDNLDSIDAICAYMARKRAAASTASS